MSEDISLSAGFSAAVKKPLAAAYKAVQIPSQVKPAIQALSAEPFLLPAPKLKSHHTCFDFITHHCNSTIRFSVRAY
jgi:hypothetical protein